MNYSEVIKILSVRLEQSQVETKRLLYHSTDIMQKMLDREIRISIPGLGAFYVHTRKRRKSFNPYIKKFMMLQPKRVLSFRPGSPIKNELKHKRVENV